jgi:sugar lactone lactonase YvrE
VDVELMLDGRAEIGESPIWDEDAGDLLWVDILPGLVHRFDPLTGQNRTMYVGQPVGAVALTNEGPLLLAVRDGFALLDQNGETALLIEVDADNAQGRMNDGACDARGRYWAGTTQADRAPGTGSLYRLDPPTSVVSIVTGATLPNGIDWSPDGELMYFIDSASGCVDVFSFDLDTGIPTDRRHLVVVPEAAGMPDGLTVDAEGYLWVALYRGGAVRRYAPNGQLDFIVDLPVSLVTSCAFGDPDLASLYITTASRGLDAEALRREPEAGGLFRVRPGVTGRPSNRFGRVGSRP